MTDLMPGDGPRGGRPHFVLVPLLAQGHMIPMVDMARLLADRGVLVTLVTTAVNAARIQPLIDRVDRAGLPVRFLALRFPCAEVGLPEGCENVDMIPARELTSNFLEAGAMLRGQLVQHLRDRGPRPTCVISDVYHPWTRHVAQEFGIPRLAFNGFGIFAILCIHNIRHHKIRDKIDDDHEPFLVPDLPYPQIEVTKAQVPGYFPLPGMEKFREELVEADKSDHGILLNSFDDLEASYGELYSKARGKKVWTVGPLSLCSRDVTDMAVRGDKASVDENHCLEWLDSMKPNSVIYVSFGSIARTSPLQLVEIGLALEASNCPFIWVIKAGERMAQVEKWLMSEGFEERTRARGLVIRGWAPQVMILSHPAVGGFMTHCGWNSTLEAVTAGVPMITWPHFAEQFLNEKLVVQVLKIGVSVGVQSSVNWAEAEEDNNVQVKRDDVEKAILKLMDEGEEGEERRKRVKEFGEKAVKAMQDGGSSFVNMTQVIQSASFGAQAEGERLGLIG